MAVRPDAPWYWKSLAMLAAVAALLASGWILAQVYGGAGALQSGDAERELARLQTTLDRQESELAVLRSSGAQSDRQVQIDRAAAADLAKQVKGSRSKTRH